MWVLRDHSKGSSWGFVRLTHPEAVKHLTNVLGYQLVSGAHLATYTYDWGMLPLYLPEGDSYWDMVGRPTQLGHKPTQFLVAIDLSRK
jgi:hypothetical protein